MTKADKILEWMRSNPRGDWQIADLRSAAGRHGIDHWQPGTSHCMFSYPGVQPVTVPAHKPIRPVYVRQFVKLIDAVQALAAKGEP